MRLREITMDYLVSCGGVSSDLVDLETALAIAHECAGASLPGDPPVVVSTFDGEAWRPQLTIGGAA